MARKQSKRFIEKAKQIMDENIHLARFNETLRNIDKLKNKHIELTEENEILNLQNDKLKNLIVVLNDNNHILHDQIYFLEEIINSLQVIVSIKDLNKRNLLWYNQNYNRLLGYKHKELQELNSEEALSFYHPEDRAIIEERNKLISDNSQNRFSCVIRLKHVNGNWLKMNSDYIVLKRNPDGSQSQAIEILTNIQAD
jgi:PAS domain S-box-containing protein